MMDLLNISCKQTQERERARARSRVRDRITRLCVVVAVVKWNEKCRSMEHTHRTIECTIETAMDATMRCTIRILDCRTKEILFFFLWK